MDETKQGSSLSWIGVAVALVVFAGVLSLLLPAVQAAREASRRAGCLSNLSRINLGFQNMDSAKRRFPSAVSIAKDDDGAVTSMTDAGCGWSWGAQLAPYIYEELHAYPDLETDTPFTGYGNPDSASYATLGIGNKAFACPSFSGGWYVDRATKAEFITNYKVNGGTHTESLAQGTPIAATVKPGYTSPYHPDGACYPGSTHGTDGFSKDGTAHTAVLVETIEPFFARWTVGVESVLVGLPPVAADFTEPDVLYYAAPVGYTPGRFWSKSTVVNNYTYLQWDYDETPYDDTNVLSQPGGLVAPIPPAVSSSATARPTRMKYGPSSNHAGVVIHGLADGSVQSIAEDIDAAAYMFLLSRIGGEPN